MKSLWFKIQSSLILAAVVAAVWAVPLPALAQGPCGSTLTVTLGDTLTSLAERCNTSVAAFLEANPEVADPNLIHVGQTLAVPQAEAPETPQVYVVQAGDTLTRIAARFGVTVEGLLEANPAVQNRDMIYVGQRLALPGADAGLQVAISPTEGPPGTRVQVSAAGFPADTEVQIGAGVVNTEFGLEADATTDASGALAREIVLPDFAEAGEQWVVVVRVVGTEIRATSERFNVTEPGEGGTVQSVELYLVALGDAGQRGALIGCDDSLVPVEIPIAPTRAPLRAALNELLAIESEMWQGTDLYTALYRSDLTLEDVAIVGGTARIRLSGTLLLGGACDTPRFEQQIRGTALQFPTVSEVEVWINGTPLDEALSARG
jgi:LysM repeat protein